MSSIRKDAIVHKKKRLHCKSGKRIQEFHNNQLSNFKIMDILGYDDQNKKKDTIFFVQIMLI